MRSCFRSFRQESRNSDASAGFPLRYDALLNPTHHRFAIKRRDSAKAYPVIVAVVAAVVIFTKPAEVI